MTSIQIPVIFAADVRWSDSAGAFEARCPALGVLATGETAAEAEDALKQAFQAKLRAIMLEHADHAYLAEHAGPFPGAEAERDS